MKEPVKKQRAVLLWMGARGALEGTELLMPCRETSSALGPGVVAVAWRGAPLSRGAAGISASLGSEDQGYPTRTGTVGNPRSCADCVKCTPFPRAYRHSYKRSKDGRNDIPLLIIVWSHLYIWCYVTNSSLLFSSREVLL